MAINKSGSSNGDASPGMNDTTSTADNLKASAGQAFDQAREKVGEAGGKAAETAKAQISDGKDRVADGIDNVASALRHTSDQLREDDTGFVGDYMNKAADAVSNISQHLRENDLDQLMRETEDFARREPTIFLGSAFALGVIAARFLKSSSGRRSQGYESNTYRAGMAEDYSGAGAYYGRDYGSDDNERIERNERNELKEW